MKTLVYNVFLIHKRTDGSALLQTVLRFSSFKFIMIAALLHDSVLTRKAKNQTKDQKTTKWRSCFGRFRDNYIPIICSPHMPAFQGVYHLGILLSHLLGLLKCNPVIIRISLGEYLDIFLAIRIFLRSRWNDSVFLKMVNTILPSGKTVATDFWDWYRVIFSDQLEHVITNTVAQ